MIVTPWNKLRTVLSSVDGQLKELRRGQEELRNEWERVRAFESELEQRQSELGRQALELERRTQELCRWQEEHQAAAEKLKREEYEHCLYEDEMFAEQQLWEMEQLCPGNRARLESYRDKHKGQTCFVIGNGPSLRAEDLTELHRRGIPCFAAKRINLIYPQTEWRPLYYMVSDEEFVREHAQEIDRENPCDRFLGAFSLLRDGVRLPRTAYYPFNKLHRATPYFSMDPLCRGFYWSGTIAYKMIQMACFMGFSRIYLLGVDNTANAYIDDNGNAVYTQQKDLHFSSKYQGLDCTQLPEYALPNIGFMNRCYYEAMLQCRQAGIEIFNATRGGALEVFPRVEFDEVMQNISEGQI